PGDGPRTLEQLVEPGEFDSSLADHLDRCGAFPKDRPLYEHQIESIRTGHGGDHPHEQPLSSFVVSAGTGAGKTECFLLPAMNRLWRVSRQQRNRGSGVKCLLLYPMNALVNDQVERIYQWL